MPRPDMTVHTVTLSPGSPEYQKVASKFQATAGRERIQKIERVQNPHLLSAVHGTKTESGQRQWRKQRAAALPWNRR